MGDTTATGSKQGTLGWFDLTVEDAPAPCPATSGATALFPMRTEMP